MARAIALVVAAGRGHRLGGETPKQYLTLGGRAVIRYCLDTFAEHPQIDAVRAVIHPDDRGLYDQASTGLTLLEPVHGGASRQESVWLGLRSLESLSPELVLIHDAARPFMSRQIIEDVINALGDHVGATAAVPMRDTVKRAENALVAETIDRSSLWRAQTPQGFHFKALLTAHEDCIGMELTDDSAIIERTGGAVFIAEDHENNFKITTRMDLERANSMMLGPNRSAMAEYEYRTGQGFDVHRFGPGNGVILCGIHIPHTHGLIGHSDADAALHALTDALLGAAAAGDIGMHFPPSDPRWKDADSATFLRHANRMITQRGGRVANVDVTIVCERPKIGPHRDAMANRVAEILELPIAAVCVKATTTERLGFLGRGEGIAAQAIATIKLPLDVNMDDSRRSHPVEQPSPGSTPGV